MVSDYISGEIDRAKKAEHERTRKARTVALGGCACGAGAIADECVACVGPMRAEEAHRARVGRLRLLARIIAYRAP